MVVDTSGSMSPELLGMALGSIASYGAAREVPLVRVIFCDARAYDAGYLAPEGRAGGVQGKGRGGGDDSAAGNRSFGAGIFSAKGKKTSFPNTGKGVLFFTAVKFSLILDL